jgi:hypothetical protein
MTSSQRPPECTVLAISTCSASALELAALVEPHIAKHVKELLTHPSSQQKMEMLMFISIYQQE